ncbi:MAG: acetylxylan esterase [Paludibacteraceae bacterium]|nr:acetylxylan esterase [Paludibacteraceae bacterium]
MRIKFYLVALTAVMLGACGCEHPTPVVEPDPQTDTTEVVEPADLSLVKSSVPVTDNWIWSGKPQIVLHMENPNEGKAVMPIVVRISTDTKQFVTEIKDSVAVAGKGTIDYIATTPENLEPGFYRAVCFVNSKNIRSFIFGIDPFEIVSAPDMQPDFDAFWQTAKVQLAAVDMNPVLTEIENHSSASRKVYLVELYSVPDGLEGEPVKIRGYYCEPQDGQAHPVILHFYGYDTQGTKSKVECPYGGNSTYAEFYLSHRGQYLNNRPAGTNPGVDEATENIYGDWFAYHFGDKDSYYYRGAFLDCVQAVRFMATRETSDMNKLFAEGSSQGGALSYACASLCSDLYPFTAIAPNVAFLGDFPDYFQIVGWPAETAKAAAKSAGMTDEEMYAFLSYFDTKNLATKISAAVLASSGLQDGTCPPHTNVAPFNNLLTPESDKEYVFAPEMQHDYPQGWMTKVMNFFKARM